MDRGKVLEKETQLIKRSETPEAWEFPLEKLDGPITPNELFFIRSHFETPKIEADQWRVLVEGCVERPLELSLADLKGMPKVNVEAVLECAGNGRTALDPPAPGLQWHSGAVGNAVWSGVSVRTVLNLAGITEESVDVVFEGADKGKVANPEAPRGELHYARSIPKELALSGNPILAYEMNGLPLEPSHGFPVRLIVPGWYGAASVKWVERIRAIDHAFGGYYQTTDYSFWGVKDGLPELRPIGAMPVKSVIARPTKGEQIRLGDRLEISGAAWTGAGQIVNVDVSLDGGHTWENATLAPARPVGSWRLWSFDWWATGSLGMREILARATDSEGRVQPAERSWVCRSYMIDHSIPVEVEVLA